MPHLPNQPRRPEQGALQQLVRDHFETFRAQAAHLCDGQGLPCFVEQEFRDFLTCGCLAAGFARFRCPDCQLDRAAHLVDHVFPDVPIRQFVLTLPPRLRYLLAWDHTLCRAVAGTTLLTCRTRRRWVAGTRASRGSICMRASWCRPAIAIGWNVCAATRSHPCSLGNARWGPRAAAAGGSGPAATDAGWHGGARVAPALDRWDDASGVRLLSFDAASNPHPEDGKANRVDEQEDECDVHGFGSVFHQNCFGNGFAAGQITFSVSAS